MFGVFALLYNIQSPAREPGLDIKIIILNTKIIIFSTKFINSNAKIIDFNGKNRYRDSVCPKRRPQIPTPANIYAKLRPKIRGKLRLLLCIHLPRSRYTLAPYATAITHTYSAASVSFPSHRSPHHPSRPTSTAATSWRFSASNEWSSSAHASLYSSSSHIRVAPPAPSKSGFVHVWSSAGARNTAASPSPTSGCSADLSSASKPLPAIRERDLSSARQVYTIGNPLDLTERLHRVELLEAVRPEADCDLYRKSRFFNKETRIPRWKIIL